MKEDIDKREVFEIDESDWQKYVHDCQAEEINPSIHDYLLWCEEHDMVQPEIWDGTIDV